MRASSEHGILAPQNSRMNKEILITARRDTSLKRHHHRMKIRLKDRASICYEQAVTTITRSLSAPGLAMTVCIVYAGRQEAKYWPGAEQQALLVTRSSDPSRSP
jgi:hypothetical protein